MCSRRRCGIISCNYIGIKKEKRLLICHHCFFFGFCIFSHTDFIDVSYDYAISEWRFYNPDKFFMAGEWPIFYSEEMFEILCPIHTKYSYKRENDILLKRLTLLRQIKNMNKELAEDTYEL